MSVTKLEEVKRQAALETGSNLFFRKHRELSACEANSNIIGQRVLLKFPQALDSLESWESAYAEVSAYLAPPVQEERVAEAPPEKWPHPFMPEVHTEADVKRIPRKVYTDLYNDRNARGELTERAKTFRRVVNAILEGEQS